MAYSDGRHLLILKAGQSYLESQYYDTARLLFKKVLSLDNQDTLALFLYLYTSAHHFYFKNMFTRALMFAESAHALKMDEHTKNSYMDSLNRLISDLLKEIKKKRK